MCYVPPTTRTHPQSQNLAIRTTVIEYNTRYVKFIVKQM